jgi:diacylglycerol O-acyltransferase / wax synthase
VQALRGPCAPGVAWNLLWHGGMPALQRLSSLDATFLALSTPEVPFVPGCVLELDRRIAVEPLRATIDALTLRIPRYRQRISRAPRVWVDDPAFAIERHVTSIRVPAPGGSRELMQLVGSLLTSELPTDHAPWRLWTVEGLSGGRGAIISLVHHTLVDGVAGIALLEQLLRPAPMASPPAAATAAPSAIAPDRLVDRLAADLRNRAAAWRQLRAQVQPGRHASALYDLLRLGLRPATDLGLGGGTISGERRFATFTVGLEATRSIKRAFGVTLNDVLLATIADGLRSYVVRHGTDPARLTDARAMVPVSRHGRDEHATSGNRVALLLASLHLDEPDPVRRLRRIAETMRTLKARDTAGAGDALVTLSDLTWSGVLTNVFRVALWRRAFNLIVTNVPGPPIPLYLLDARVTQLVPILNLWPHVPIGIAIASYAGSITISIDAVVLTELTELVADLEAAYEKLRAASALVASAAS